MPVHHLIRTKGNNVIVSSARGLPFLTKAIMPIPPDEPPPDPDPPTTFANGYLKRIPGVISKDYIGGVTAAVFPFMVTHNDLKFKSAGGNVDNGNDTIITNSAGTALPLWVDEYNSTLGRVRGYISASSLISSGGFNGLYLYYGKAADTAPKKDNSVMSGYMAGWHLPSKTDITGNTRDLDADAVSLAGLIGPAASFVKATADNIRFVPSVFLDGFTRCSIQFLLRPTTVADTGAIYNRGSGDFIALIDTAAKLVVRVRGSGGQQNWIGPDNMFVNGTYYHVLINLDNAAFTEVFINGKAVTKATASNGPTAFGTFPSSGSVAATDNRLSIGGSLQAVAGTNGITGLVEDFYIRSSKFSAAGASLASAATLDRDNVVRWGAPEGPNDTAGPVSETIYIPDASDPFDLDVNRYVKGSGTISWNTALPTVSGLTLSRTNATTINATPTATGVKSFNLTADVV